MAVSAYLAGPDVFLPAAERHARRKIAICAAHGIDGRAPLDEMMGNVPASPHAMPMWQAIFCQNLALMESCDVVIANLTPFRGASADAGTLVELGWFLGRGRPVFGYSNTAVPFTERIRRQTALIPDPAGDLVVEDFGLIDNLMIPGAVQLGSGYPIVVPTDGRERGFDALDVFERCVALLAGGGLPLLRDDATMPSTTSQWAARRNR